MGRTKRTTINANSLPISTTTAKRRRVPNILSSRGHQLSSSSSSSTPAIDNIEQQQQQPQQSSPSSVPNAADECPSSEAELGSSHNPIVISDSIDIHSSPPPPPPLAAPSPPMMSSFGWPSSPATTCIYPPMNVGGQPRLVSLPFPCCPQYRVNYYPHGAKISYKPMISNMPPCPLPSSTNPVRISLIPPPYPMLKPITSPFFPSYPSPPQTTSIPLKRGGGGGSVRASRALRYYRRIHPKKHWIARYQSEMMYAAGWQMSQLPSTTVTNIQQ